MTTTCEIRNSPTTHSHDPEMFRVTNMGTGRKSTQCLDHAAKAEEKGHHVEIILT